MNFLNFLSAIGNPQYQSRARYGARQQSAISRRAFTLVELLVTITIIGILAGMAVIIFPEVQAKARDGRREADLSSLRNVLEMYYSENNSYPTPAGCTFPTWCNVSSLGILVPTYINPLPLDPRAGWNAYRYTSLSAGQGYCIAANLEATAGQNTCTVVLETDYDYGVGNP